MFTSGERMRVVVRKIAVLALIAAVMALLALGLMAWEQRRILYPGASGAGQVWIQFPASYRQVTLQTSDGLTLRALYRPAAPGKRTLLFFHGNGDTVSGSARIVGPLVDAGYGALLAEFRGYAGNPGKPDELGLYRDGFAARKFLTSAGVTDDRMILIGYSLGSGVVARLAADRPPAALILIAGFTSVPDAAAEHFGSLPARLVLDRFPTIEWIDEVRAPILLIHGGDDRTVYPRHSIALKRAAPAASLVIVPDQDHVVAYRPVAARIMLGWLRRHSL